MWDALTPKEANASTKLRSFCARTVLGLRRVTPRLLHVVQVSAVIGHTATDGVNMPELARRASRNGLRRTRLRLWGSRAAPS